ncbi:MAG: hypothetical protein CL608_21130 [Anaerolineaceae bacterium]|nr:hypothetical protein [Anaerolineaceae bacterium]
MAYSDKYELGDKVWYETDDGNRYLMVIKQVREDSVDLFPHDATSSLLKDESESKFRYIYDSNIRPATAATEGNLMMARKVAEVAIERAISKTEAKGQSLSHAQKKLVSQAIVQGFLEMKQQYGHLEKDGFFERLT